MNNNMYSGFYEYRGDILKWSPQKGYFLKMTGWDDEHLDRRILMCEINEDKLTKINKANVLEKINTVWNSGVRTWNFDGQTYNNSITDWNKIPFHQFAHTWYEKSKIAGYDESHHAIREDLIEPIEHTYYNSYKIVWHQGHIYWATSYYYPRIQLMEYTSLDEEPRNFIKWTNITNCRGIKNIKTDNIV